MPRERADYYEPKYQKSIQERRISAWELLQQRRQQARIAVMKKQASQAQAAQLRKQKKRGVLAEQKIMHGVYPKTVPPEFKESIAFYTEIGFPHLAGRYKPFEVPEGFKVQEITKTPEGLDVAFEHERKGISVFGMPIPIVGIGTPVKPEHIPVTHAKPLLFGLIPSPTKPQYIPGKGIVGVPTHGFLTKEGVKPLSQILEETAESRDIFFWHPQLGEQYKEMENIAGLISVPERMLFPSQIPSVFELGDKPVSYVAGRVLGEVGLAWFLGRALEPVTQPIIGKIGKKAQSWLTTRYLKKGPLAWKGFTEKLVMKVTGATPYLAPEVVSVPRHGIMQVPQVSSVIWQYGLTPKTSLLFIEKFASEQTKFLPKYFIRGTAMVPMATSMVEAAYKPMPEDYLLSAPKQIGITVKKTIHRTFPYIPKTTYFTESAKDFLAHIIAYGLVSSMNIPRGITGKKLKYETETPPITLPKPITYSEAKPKRKTKPFTFTFPTLEPSMRKREKLVPWSLPGFKAALKQPSMQKQVASQVQAQKQLTKQIVKTAIPTPTTLTIPSFPFEERRKKRRRKRKGKKKTIGIGRYKRFYPAKTPKELLEILV